MNVLVPGIFLHTSLELFVIQHFSTVLQDKSVAAKPKGKNQTSLCFVTSKRHKGKENSHCGDGLSEYNLQPGHPGGEATIVVCLNLRQF